MMTFLVNSGKGKLQVCFRMQTCWVIASGGRQNPEKYLNQGFMAILGIMMVHQTRRFIKPGVCLLRNYNVGLQQILLLKYHNSVCVM